jgi:hypothetical protein
LQIIKAGGIPKEGLGSTLNFILPTANIAHLLDADLIISQTAYMMDYRASDILNRGLELQGEGRVCDIMEILLDDPSIGPFQSRMDRAQALLDLTYDRAIKKCTTNPSEMLFSEYAMKEISRCDTLIFNDYRTLSFGYTPQIISRGWTPCSQAWWKGVIEQYSGPAHGNDIAIHYRWGDMAQRGAQTRDKWKLDITKVKRLVDIIRQENPKVLVNVYMKKSKENESENQLRQILAPLDGKYTIIEAAEDVEELAMMSKARYLILNSGSFSVAAAATSEAQVVVHNNGGAEDHWKALGIKHVFNYDQIDEGEFRKAVKL